MEMYKWINFQNNGKNVHKTNEYFHLNFKLRLLIVDRVAVIIIITIITI